VPREWVVKTIAFLTFLHKDNAVYLATTDGLIVAKRVAPTKTVIESIDVHLG
jgi:hypothetical protein